MSFEPSIFLEACSCGVLTSTSTNFSLFCFICFTCSALRSSQPAPNNQLMTPISYFSLRLVLVTVFSILQIHENGGVYTSNSNFRFYQKSAGSSTGLGCVETDCSINASL